MQACRFIDFTSAFASSCDFACVIQNDRLFKVHMGHIDRV